MSIFFTLNKERSERIPNISRLTRLTLTTWGLTLNWEESNSLPSTASTSTTPPSPPPPPRRPRAQSWRASHLPAQVKESWEKLKSQVGPIHLGPFWESVPVISHPSCIRIMGCAIWIQNLEFQITNPKPSTRIWIRVLRFESGLYWIWPRKIISHEHSGHQSSVFLGSFFFITICLCWRCFNKITKYQGHTKIIRNKEKIKILMMFFEIKTNILVTFLRGTRLLVPG